MKPEIYSPQCPDHLVKRAEEEHLARLGMYYYNAWPDIVWQEERNGRLYTYIYDGRKACEEGDRTPDYLIVADMERKKWDTYSFKDETWGKKMLGSIILYCHDPVTEYIDRKRYRQSLQEMQNGVRAEEREKRKEKKEKKTQEDMDRAEELPQAFLDWAERQLDPYLVYEPGNNHRGYCTRCGKVNDFPQKLKCHSERTCPSCRGRCTVKTPKCLPEGLESTSVYIQNTGNGIMLRYVWLYKELGTYFWRPRIKTDERIRVIIDQGERQRWYEKITGWAGTKWQQNRIEGWTRSINNPYGIYYKAAHGYRNKGYRKELPVYRRNLSYVVNRSILSYINGWEGLLGEISNRGNQFDLEAFIDLYDRIHCYPQIESLWKLGFRKLAAEAILRPGEFRRQEKKLHRYLGISKEMWRFLQKKRGGLGNHCGAWT